MAHHKIALLADTHGILREEVVQKIKDCEVIFHAGDFGGPEIVERLQQIALVYMARGNNDKEWAKEMPYFVREQIGNRTFYMCHINRLFFRICFSQLCLCPFGKDIKPISFF